MSTNTIFVNNLSEAERRGVLKIRESLSAEKVNFVSEVAKAKKELGRGEKLREQGRKATLTGLAQIYRLIIRSCCDLKDMNKLCAQLKIGKVTKKRKASLIRVVQAFRGGTDKLASKHAQVLKLGFHESVREREFFDFITGIGGIQRAADRYIELNPTKKKGRGKKGKEKKFEVIELNLDDSEWSDKGLLDTASSSSSADYSLGKGWTKLEKARNRARSDKKPISRAVEVSVEPSGQVRLRRLLPHRKLVNEAARFAKVLEEFISSKRTKFSLKSRKRKAKAKK